eukprot:19477-Prymnesium_polylepis.1
MVGNELYPPCTTAVTAHSSVRDGGRPCDLSRLLSLEACCASNKKSPRYTYSCAAGSRATEHRGPCDVPQARVAHQV